MVLSAFAFIFVFVSLLLGLIMYFTGCNPYIEGQCFSHHVVKATVVGYSYSNGTRYGCEGEACVPAVIPCYNSALVMRTKGDDVCLRSVAYCVPSLADARRSATAHAVGDHIVLNVHKNKNAAECGSRQVGLDQWILGVVFLSAAAFVCLCGGAALALARRKQHQRRLMRQLMRQQQSPLQLDFDFDLETDTVDLETDTVDLETDTVDLETDADTVDLDAGRHSVISV